MASHSGPNQNNSQLAEYIETYTTRVDTIYSAAFLVLAPEHPLVLELTTPDQKSQVTKYTQAAKKKSNLQRTDLNKDITGVFTGSYVENPVNGVQIPVWIADFVLMEYGTGVVFGDAHDQRDFVFAKKYSIPLKTTIKPVGDTDDSPIRNLEECFDEDGVLYDSGEFDGLTSAEARTQITAKLERERLGSKQKNFKLRDWLISRQRYWGAPIPIIYTPEKVLVQYNQLKLSKTETTGSEKRNKVFFGSVNEAKILRFKRLMRSSGIVVVTIHDLSYGVTILVPAEIGDSVEANAKIKAQYYWEQLRPEDKMPVVSEDVGMYLAGVEKADNPGKDLKRLAKKALGSSSIENMVTFYSQLAQKYGGRLEQTWEFWYALYDGSTFDTQRAINNGILTAEIKYPLSMEHGPNSVTLVQVGAGLEKYFGDLNDDELKQYWENNIKVVLFSLLHHIDTKAANLYDQNTSASIETNRVLPEVDPNLNSPPASLIPQVVIVHGGSSFASDEEFELWKAESKSEVAYTQVFERKVKLGQYAWYRSVGLELEQSGFQVQQPLMPNLTQAKYHEWAQTFQPIAAQLTTESNLIGHSLGGLFLVKYLSEHNLQIKSLHLVSPSGKFGNFDMDSDYWSDVNNRCENIYIWHSEDDAVVPLSEGRHYQVMLPKAALFKYTNRGHFDQLTFPELVDFIQIQEQGSWTVFDGIRYRLSLDLQLPVELPTDVDFRPDGQSPLNYSQSFREVNCPITGTNQDVGVFREKDTMDTFVCSSWYYLRYLDNSNSIDFATEQRIKDWMPVDIYIGGAEHAVLHLLYARFFYKALLDGKLNIK